jgi:hypothetical protein
MPFIHKLNKSFGNTRVITRPMGHKYRSIRNHKRVLGSGLKEEVYEDGRLQKATETLRHLKLSKPRLPKKYITFD